jgi:hypothetical protein
MAKSSIRMSELRALVLGEISHQAACPPGMDVSIIPNGAGGWRADSIPPAGSIAYADCSDYIAQVVARLGLQYDLAQEPARELNAPLEESTFNESPAGATTRVPVDFAHPEERKAWIEAQPNDVAWVIAARAALRILPTMSLASGPTGSRMTRRRMMLRVFRATAAAWAVSAYPSHQDQLRAAARGAISGLGDAQAAIPERAAEYALGAVLAQLKDVAARASTAVGYALDAAGASGRDAFEITLAAIKADAELLGQRFSPVTMANSQLWPNRLPDWIEDHWNELSTQLLAENEGWDFWTKWYEARLFAAVTNQEIEIVLVTTQDEIWQQEPAAVNKHMQDLIVEKEIFLNAFAEEAPAKSTRARPTSPGAFDGGSFNTNALNTTPYNSSGEAPQESSASASADETALALRRALVARPVPIRDSARALAQALKEQAVELQHSKPNEPEKLLEYEKLITFIADTSDGLAVLADTIDSAIQNGSDTPEPVLLGKAAEIARELQVGAMEWLQANRTTVFEGAFRLGLFGLGIAFVSALGIEVSPAVVGSIGVLVGTVGKGKAG